MPELTPGVLDGAAEHVFLYGGCAALAIALHDATGWPLVAITDADNCHDGHIGMGGSAMHWTVRHPSGRLLDVLGLHDEDDLVDGYHDDADEGQAAAAIAPRSYAVDEYVDARGEPYPIDLAATFVDAVLERAEGGSAAD
jgi:hypothetical protein